LALQRSIFEREPKQHLDFSAYLLKGPKIIFIDKSTTYKKLEDRDIDV
jgi:hypothetical protein